MLKNILFLGEKTEIPKSKDLMHVYACLRPKEVFKANNKCQKCVGKSRLYQLAQINQLQQPIRQSTQSFTFIHSELGTLGTVGF